MKAVGFTRSLPVSDPDSLRDVDLPVPVATGRDRSLTQPLQEAG